MKVAFQALLGLSLFLLLSLPRTAAAGQLVNAFTITKTTNRNVVKYDVRLEGRNCAIDEGNPLDIYWIVRNKQGYSEREGLNFFEKGLYRLDIEKKSPHQLIAEVKALRQTGQKLPLRIVTRRKGDGCQVMTYLSGATLPARVIVTTLRLENFQGFRPKDVAINGTDPRTHKALSYTVKLG